MSKQLRNKWASKLAGNMSKRLALCDLKLKIVLPGVLNVKTCSNIFDFNSGSPFKFLCI